MLVFSDLGFSKTLPLSIFNQLGELLQQIGSVVESDALSLTEAILVRVEVPIEWQKQKFKLIVSPGFNALLVGNLQAGEQEIDSPVNTIFTFNTDAIALFISQLCELFKCDSHIYQTLDNYRQVMTPNDSTLQSQFTLLLLEYLLPHSPAKITTHTTESCQVIEDAFRKQIAQEQVYFQIFGQVINIVR